MAGTGGAVFVDHAQFMTYAARVMRGLIIDEVRRRRSEKRGTIQRGWEKGRLYLHHVVSRPSSSTLEDHDASRG